MNLVIHVINCLNHLSRRNLTHLLLLLYLLLHSSANHLAYATHLTHLLLAHGILSVLLLSLPILVSLSMDVLLTPRLILLLRRTCTHHRWFLVKSLIQMLAQSIEIAHLRIPLLQVLNLNGIWSTEISNWLYDLGRDLHVKVAHGSLEGVLSW